MKFSIITATYNREDTVADAIESLHGQSFGNFEHLVQDGRSADRTVEIVKASADARTFLESKPDSGIYDAINRAISRATGDVIGLLHSDDFFASDRVLEKVAAAFADPEVDAVYGDLHYVCKHDPKRIVRKWVSCPFLPDLLKTGWMPAHPTLFLRRSIVDRLGAYDTSYSIAADYDAILRYFSEPGFTAVYLPAVLVKMRVGGESNRSLERVLRKSQEDYRALRGNEIGGIATLVRKNASKVRQFF
ncbi:glycosyltransferase family 2 protein [Aliiruegeria lutimaris]|uniref:Glycosyltransferase n=1 Tax=Aliiruegeria lutimaris TaxID=571298 RepID=A0A1G9DWE4_9RHOB|nr:glycosyltransferase family 2 protein [Aliiruegeria lutimaris]SDK68202.1 glycosyltransferase [Aliiruegeria lutimaris]